MYASRHTAMSSALCTRAERYFIILYSKRRKLVKLSAGCFILISICVLYAHIASNSANHTVLRQTPFNVKYINQECVDQNNKYDRKRSKVVDLRIIVLTYNRERSLERLLRSLNAAFYGNASVQLDVWIDRSTDGRVDDRTVGIADTFRFEHGTKRVCVQPRHVGILGQWLTPWKPGTSEDREIAVFLEDDLTVSPHFYTYLKLVHERYHDEHHVNGFALQGEVMKLASRSSGYVHVPVQHRVFLYPTLGTWGYSPRARTWALFRDWFQYIYSRRDFQPIIPGHLSSEWFLAFAKTGSQDSIWEIWYIYFSWINQEYSLYPNFKDNKALTFNWREDGLHYQGSKETDAQADKGALLLDWRSEYEELPDLPVKVDLNGDIVPVTTW